MYIVLTLIASDQDKDSAVKINMLQNLGLMASRLNISLGFWEDGLNNKTNGSNTPFIKEDVFPDDIDVYGYVWQTVWEWWGGDRAFNMANGGYKVHHNLIIYCYI